MSKSRSRSHSPVNSGQITYITSFGGDDSDSEGHVVQGPVLPGPAPPPTVPTKNQQPDATPTVPAKPKPRSRSVQFSIYYLQKRIMVTL